MTDANLHSTQDHLETYSHLRQEDPSQSSEEHLEEKYRELTEKLRNAWTSYQTCDTLSTVNSGASLPFNWFSSTPYFTNFAPWKFGEVVHR